MLTNTRVAASDVTDRETLKGFVEGGVNYLRTLTTLPEIMMFRDRLQTEGFWKSDSQFLMLLTPNGNILWHGEDPSAENKNVIAVEDNRGKKVVHELLAQAKSGGGFVEYHWDDPTQSDDPLHKLSYAASYTSAWSGNTLILIGGYEQDLSKISPHIEDLPPSAVTASEVVDRETLRIFVEESAKVFQEAYMTENYSGLAGTKNAFRVEGNWKAGSTYVWVVSDEGVVVFHGLERHRESKPANLDREGVNGVKFVRDLIATGAAGGGYVEYSYDNPMIDGDEETGSPKVDYAAPFTLPGREGPFVVVSGIYLTSSPL